MKDIKMIVLDVDGTLTDGKIYLSNGHLELKAFNIKDGLRIAQLKKYDILPVIITGRQSEIVNIRARELHIKEVHQNVENKVGVLKETARKYNISMCQIAYIGDDENDLESMSICRYVGCPKNAAEKVLEIAHFVSKFNGGDGAVREFLDWIIEDY